MTGLRWNTVRISLRSPSSHKNLLALTIAALLSFGMVSFNAALAQTASGSTILTIGETKVASVNDGGNGNLLCAQKATLSQTATLQSLSFYVRTTGGKLRLGVYNAKGPNGGPGALIAQAAEITPVVGWNKVNVTTPVSLPAGTYWLAYFPQKNTLGFQNEFSGQEYHYRLTYGALPSTFSKRPSGGGDQWSFFATLNTSTQTPPPPVNGACGSANGTTVATVPTTNLCSTGTASTISGTGPWSWSCAGTNGGSTAQCSANKTFVDTTPPSVPTGLAATTGSTTQINLSWTASTDNVGVTGYNVMRNGTKIGTTSVTSYSNTGLTASTSYSYTVSAFDAAGNTSIASAVASATTQAPPDTTPPSVPTGLTATAVSTTQINLAWTASTDNVGVTGYQIFRNGTQVGTPATTSFSDTGLTASTSYSYTVKATDSAGNVSAASTAASATTQAVPVNGSCGSANGTTLSTKPTTNLCSTGNSSTVAGSGPWTWSCAGSNGGSTAQCSAAVTPPIGSAITMGETNVASVDDGGNGGLLLAQQATLSQTATLQSLSFYVRTTGGNLRLGVYDATGPNGGPGALLARTPELTPIAGWNTSNVTTPVSLPAGTYWLAYFPQSNNLGFQNEFTGQEYHYSLTYGPLPATFSTAPSGGGDQWSFYATLNTVPPAPVNGACGPVSGTIVFAIPASNLCSAGAASTVAGTGPWTWSCAGLSGGGTAQCTASKGLDTTPPSVPAGLVATAVSSSQINLSWTASTDNVGVTGYNVMRNGTKVGTSSTANYNDTGLTASTSYTYTVSAFDAANNVSAASTSVSATTLAAGNSTVQVPGPSQALFNNPYYSCVHNYYVAANGNDANNGSSNAPWLTLQHADSMNLGAGSCVNVAPGTYDGLTVTHGGNLASSTGYVVYRCTTMDACTINGDAGPNWNGSVTFDYTKVKAGVPNTVNYVQFDGFVLAGAPLANQGPWGVGFNVYNGTNNQEIASHHVWLLNSIVHGFSQGGISLTAAEYHYAIHNMSYDNGNTTCDAQGSGISVFIEHPLPNYAQTADDFTNPNPLIGTFQRGDGQFFHNVIAWNITYNNALTQCGTVANAYDTDGNGIIFDTNALAAGNSVDYPYPMLAAFNLSYNNGGGGVHLFSSAHITVANNSCYNNYLDPAISGSARGCIDDNQGFDNTFINNIAVAIPTAHTTCAYSVAPYAMWNSAVLGVPLQAPFDTFNHNVTNIEGGSSSCNGEIVAVNGDTYSTSANKESTNPLWVNVGATSTGSETMPPIGADFRLQAGSPALGYALSEPYLPSYTTDAGAYQSGAVTGDATPPSVPTGLTATAASTTQINLSWTASTDNVGVKNYQVFRNGTQVGAPTTTSYSDTGLTASTSYSYTVKATDAAGNVSIASSIASATTQALQVPPVNGACGTSNGSTVATKPTTNLCSTGTSSTVAGTGPWSWSCAGTNGGTTAMCSAQLAPPPVNGTCGLSNGTTLASLPTANLCSTGTASTVSGTGPWSWSCAGSNNGTTAACSAQLASSSPTSAQKPGPSVDLFNHPYYSCQHNFYVNGATGNDSYDGTSPTFVGGTTGPWATIANADTSLRTGGDCINVAPGTYGQFNEDLKYGGFKAQSTGYVVYRCTVPSFISGTGCVITDSYKAAHAGQWTTSSKYPNYLIFDGFNFESSDPTLPDAVAIGCSGPGTFGTTQTTSVGCHHWWIINNIINGYGIAGVGNGDTEYWYTAHNTVTQNAHQVCMGYYGSGIGYVVAKPVAGYQKTPDDLNANNNPSLNLMGIQGPNFGFNNVIAWNVVGNNYQGCSGFGLGNTDGNGIIIDTFNITPCNANQVDYPNSTLVAFNVVYNSGGGGVHVFASANVTVANNSTFNNFLDPTISAWERANIDISCGVGTNGFGANTDLLINNIAYALPNGQACPGPNNSYMGSMVPFGIGGDNTQIDGLFNSPGRNISYSVGITCNPTGASENTTFGVNPDWNCTTNKCMTNPLWVNVGNTSIGTLQTPPNGINFALQPGSPAIGYGVTEPYLPASSVDAGACSSQFTTCP